MSWNKDWDRISSRMAGFTAAARLIGAGDPTRLGIPDYLQKQWNSIFGEIDGFFSTHQGAVPADAHSCFAAFKSNYAHVISSSQPANVPSRLAYLVALKSELDFHLVNPDVFLSATTERAFMHLQRLIVADPEVRTKWATAFAEGEESCERFGGTHLLHHGIWAFKANTKGARTDLILGEAANPTVETRRALHGLVLTEWKMVRDGDDPIDVAGYGVRQAEYYSSGALGGFELRDVRYIVLVSARQTTPPSDQATSKGTYRHINIATDPAAPSVAAKR